MALLALLSAATSAAPSAPGPNKESFSLNSFADTALANPLPRYAS